MAQNQKRSKIDMLTVESRADIDRWIAKYPSDRKQSAVMAALRIVQDQNGGWLSNELMDAIAEYLEMPPIAVYEVATFYGMYRLRPAGRHVISVCTNISCMLNGSDQIVSHLENTLNIRLGETTPDGRFTLKEVECLGACVGAPMLQIGRDYHEHLTPAKLDEVLGKLE